MNSFSSELGVQFGTCLEAPHVIDVESQVRMAFSILSLVLIICNWLYSFSSLKLYCQTFLCSCGLLQSSPVRVIIH